MKKVLFTLAALLSLVSAIAQEGEIIYTDYEPDLHVYTPYPFYSMDVDLDFDSIPDIQLFFNRPEPATYKDSSQSLDSLFLRQPNLQHQQQHQDIFP